MPAFLISPWVARDAVNHTLFEHTSIARTTLARFCPQEDYTMMGARLAAAPLLTPLLEPQVRSDVPVAAQPVELVELRLQGSPEQYRWRVCS